MVLANQIALSQWREYHFEEIGPKDGLTTNINAIAKDSTGLIYLATGQGLMVYDGTEFKSFVHDPNDSFTVSAGEIWNLKTGQDGNIWLGFRFNGLNKYSPKTGKFTRYSFPASSVKNTPVVTSILKVSPDTFKKLPSHISSLYRVLLNSCITPVPKSL